MASGTKKNGNGPGCSPSHHGWPSGRTNPSAPAIIQNNVNAPVITSTTNVTKKKNIRLKNRRCMAYEDLRRGGGNGSLSGHHAGRVS